MNNRNLFRAASLLLFFVLACASVKVEEELGIGYVGKLDIASVNGTERVDLFCVTNKTFRYKPFVVWWFAKTNSHQALATGYTNGVVAWGDTLSCFKLSRTELFIFTGITNVGNPFSEKEIRNYCTPVFDALNSGKDFPGVKRLNPESVLPQNALGSPPRPYGFKINISNIILTSSNVTLELDAAQMPWPGRFETNKQAILTFGKGLNLIRARAITNMNPSAIPITTNASPIQVPIKKQL